MNDRRKKYVEPTQNDLNRKRMHDLRERESAIQEKLHGDKPVVDGEIDFGPYEKLLDDLRAVRGEMASLTIGEVL